MHLQDNVANHDGKVANDENPSMAIWTWQMKEQGNVSFSHFAFSVNSRTL